MGIERLTILFLTIGSLFEYEIDNSGRTMQYKLDAQSLHHSGNVNDAHRAGGDRLQNKQTNKKKLTQDTILPLCLLSGGLLTQTWIHGEKCFSISLLMQVARAQAPTKSEGRRGGEEGAC